MKITYLSICFILIQSFSFKNLNAQHIGVELGSNLYLNNLKSPPGSDYSTFYFFPRLQLGLEFDDFRYGKRRNKKIPPFILDYHTVDAVLTAYKTDKDTIYEDDLYSNRGVISLQSLCLNIFNRSDISYIKAGFSVDMNLYNYAPLERTKSLKQNKDLIPIETIITRGNKYFKKIVPSIILKVQFPLIKRPTYAVQWYYSFSGSPFTYYASPSSGVKFKPLVNRLGITMYFKYREACKRSKSLF